MFYNHCNILQENFIILSHCLHYNEPTQAQCAYRSKNKVTGVVTACPQYFYHVCVHGRLPSMHVSSALRIVKVCSCDDHCQSILGLPFPLSHGIKFLKRDNRGNHYYGEVFIYSPPSTLPNHVKETMAFASGSVRAGNIAIENTSVAEKMDQSSPRTDLGGARSEVATCSTVSSASIAKREPESFLPSEMVRLLKLAVDKNTCCRRRWLVLKVPFAMKKATSRFSTIVWNVFMA